MGTQHNKEFDKEADNKFIEDSCEDVTDSVEGNSDDPLRIQKAADALVQKHQLKHAAKLYRKSMQLYIESGKIFSAITAKVLELKIIKHSSDKARDIYTALHKLAPNSIPSYEFFARMSYAELLGVMQALEVDAFSPNTIIKKPGDGETELYFVVSGVLKETADRVSAENPDQQSTLIENAFRGDIYPLEEEKVCCATLEAITDVELLKISKYDLVRLAQKNSNLEFLARELLITRYGTGGRRAQQVIRATHRYQLLTKVELKVLSDVPNESPFVLSGFTEDLSLGGACIWLSAAYLSGSNLVGKKVILALRVAQLLTGVDIPGTIAWKREVKRGKGKDILIGIQFKEMPPEDFEFVKRHCYIGEGAEQMIYSMWQSCVKK